MSTFKGLVQEFPQIRIDYFRPLPGHKPPLACFLSHVHSDHLTGLESFRAPFVYCSPATREILLRLEKYHYRLNYARGILESHNVTYDRHLRRVAKPLPLNTPTAIELAPGNTIQVTLIDANHCVGAVMFLIEARGKAILYTGDIRAEAWWVNGLVQNPVLLPYTLGSRRLECIYLDTTFAANSEVYREFPSKAEGIRELLEKVDAYPSDTVFYFHAWTFGYEDVWIALANFLRSRIHLDDYRARLYGSLSTLDKKSLREAGLEVPSENKYLQESGLQVREAPALCGFRNGNRIQPGCLTSNPEVRIHSCERGMGCPAMDKNDNAVHITPIISRMGNTEILEVGAGGGNGDLDQKEELDTADATVVGKLKELCTEMIQTPDILSKVLALLQQAVQHGNVAINLDIDPTRASQGVDAELSLPELISALTSHASKSRNPIKGTNRTIHFPYSRHSSYSELCGLVAAFKPKDVFPCTVDEARWDPSVGMRYLFGEFCSENIFRHDTEMLKLYEAKLEQESNKRELESQLETQNTEMDAPSPVAVKRRKLDDEILVAEQAEMLSDTLNNVPRQERKSADISTPVEPPKQQPPMQEETHVPSTAPDPTPALAAPTPKSDNDITRIPATVFNSASAESRISTPRISSASRTRQSNEAAKAGEIFRSREANKNMAHQAALGIRLTWADYGGLVSTRKRGDKEGFEEIL